MPRQPSCRTDSGPGPDAAPDRLSAEQLRRLAEMIADGHCPVPQDLPVADAERLSREVRHQLRDRLVRLIARAVARHLRRAAGPHTESPDHA
jgi:hypothetical protein